MTTLADALVDALAERGVRRLFGIPGGGSSLDVMEAARKRGLDFILTRTEAAGTIMAAVTGELTETPGVMLAGVGPGAASAVNGMAYASLERAPLVLLTDGPASSLHQAFDQQALFRPVAKRTARLRPEHGGAQAAILLDVAMAGPRGPIHLDLTAGDAAAPATGARTAPPAPPIRALDAGAVVAARTLLAGSRKPVILAGLEVRYGGAHEALLRLAEALSAPVLLTYKAKGCLSDSHPLMAGMLTGASSEHTLIGEADLIITFGLDPIELIPGTWPHRAPVLDLAAWRHGDGRYTTECRVHGTLSEIVDALMGDAVAGDWPETEINAHRARLAEPLSLTGSNLTMDTVVRAAAGAAPGGTRACVDAGAHMFSTMGLWPAERPHDVLKSNGLSTMGYALPAAMASAMEDRDKPVIAFTGDGGLLMCLAELATAAALGLPIVVVVANDAALSLIDVKQQRQQRPSIGVRTAPVDFAAAALALGCWAQRAGPEDDLDRIISAAFTHADAHKGPALVEVITDPSGYGAQLEAIRG